MTPSFVKILLDGNDIAEISPPLILLGAHVTHQLNRHPHCVLRYRQPPGSRFFYEPMIGKDLKVMAVDDQGAELELFRGVLRQADAEWELNGSCVFTFEGISKSYQRDVLLNCQTFNEVSFQDASTRLLDNLTGDYVGTDFPNLQMIQFNETDWSFLSRLADRFGFFLRVDGNHVDLYESFQGEAVQMPWRTENGLQVFKTTGRITGWTVNGANFEARPATSRAFTLFDTQSDLGSLSDLRSGALDGGATNNLSTGMWTRFLVGTHDAFEKNLKLESHRQMIHSCVAYGESRIPEIKVGEKINITDNDDFPGQFGLFRIVHEWVPGHGYRNRFECTPYATYMERERVPEARYWGTEIARVSDITYPDDRIAYVRVNFLWEQHQDTGWLPVLTPNAGANRGICFIPEIGDEVLVFFRGGDSCKPLVLGSVWNGVDVAPLDDLHGGEYANNDIKRIVTKSGNRLIFDDKAGSETMVMATPNHVRVSLFDGGQTLLLHSDGDIKIHAGGTVHMKCNQFLREVG